MQRVFCLFRKQRFYLSVIFASLIFSIQSNANPKELQGLIPPPLIKREVALKHPQNPAQVIKFTDCMESSLLRTVQTFFINLEDPTKMDTEFLKQRVKDEQLLTFLNKHFTIFDGQVDDGLPTRTEWAKFLSQRSQFSYKKENIFEVLASVSNLVHFLSKFFKYPDINTQTLTDLINSKQYSIALQKMCSSLSRPGFAIECNLQHEMKAEGTAEEPLELSYSTIVIRFNETPYLRWEIRETYNKGVRVSGHSQIYQVATK